MSDESKNLMMQNEKQSEKDFSSHIYPDIKTISEALHKSENRFNVIADHLDAGIAECGLDGKFTFINKAFTSITGYNDIKLYALQIQDIIHPDDLTRYNHFFKQLTDAGISFKTELRLLHADGSEVQTHYSASLLKDNYNKPISFIATVVISNIYKPEEKKWLEKDQSFEILESISDAFFIVDRNWKFTYANRKAEQLNKRNYGELLGKLIWDEFPGLDASEYGKLYRQVAELQSAGSVTARSAADNYWYEVHAFPVRNGIAVYFKNVTDQVEAETALRRSEENYRTLFNTIDEGFCIIDMMFDESGVPFDYRFLEYNHVFEEMTGLQDALGKTARELVPGLEPFWFEMYGKVALTGEPVRFENHSEPMQRWFNVYASRTGDAGSRKVAIVFSNITQRKLIERDRERFLSLGSDLQAIGGGNGYYFTWVSSAWERVLGYTIAEMTSTDWRKLVHPDDLIKTEIIVQNNLSGEEIIAWENRYRHKDGSYRWFSWNSKPYLKEGYRYGVATDITERKEAEDALRESEERYSAIIHQATAGVAEINLDSSHIFVNKKFCEMTGFGEEELYKLKCFDYVHPDDKAHCRELFEQTLTTGKPFVSEKRIICKDKTEIWINETISCISDARNKTKSIVAVCIDISDRKTIEKQKDEFMAVASHELKTPVTSLKAYAQVLNMRFVKAGDNQSAGMLQKMENQINRLTLLVQDLLDVTRVEGKRLEFRPQVFDFGEMVMNTIKEVQRTLPSHFIECNNIPGASVFADVERTAQVLINLLTNAAKYSPNANRVLVQLSVMGSDVICSVKDFGIGIPAESQKHIFDRFYRVADKESTYPGLGLGLYISSEIVKRQQGDIWFKSLVNEGSVFSFRLPLYHQS